MRPLLLLILLVVTNAYDPSQVPPESNPSTDYRSHAALTDMPSFVVEETSRNRAATPCNLNAISAATGSALSSLVRDAPTNCLNGLFDYTNAQFKDTCNEADMTTIADGFASTVSSYDGTKATSSPGLTNFILYMRACYFILDNSRGTLPAYSANLIPKIRVGLDTFFKRPNIEAQNDANYYVDLAVLNFVTNIRNYLNYASTISAFLVKFFSNNAWKFGSNIQPMVIDAIFENLRLVHTDAAAATYFCKHPEIGQNLNDFLDKQGSLVNTNGDYIFRNAAGELVSLMTYSCLTTQVSGYLKKQLAKYTQTSAPKFYTSVAAKLAGLNTCANFNLCTYRSDLEKKTLPVTRTCNKTRTDTYRLRAQQITDAEFDEVCKRLAAQENHFHTLMKDNWKPVASDINSVLELIIFNSDEDYKFYATIIFGIDTKNGGIYMEGDPQKQGNLPRFYCFKQLNNGKFDVWNLEHEFSHYLDGRYNKVGGGDPSLYSMWWTEGSAEYAANKQQYRTMVDTCKAKQYPLSTIFANNRGSSKDRIYSYGYLAARFMFERHRTDVDTMLGFLRSASWSQYDKFIVGIGQKYDQEFISWCGCIANGKAC